MAANELEGTLVRTHADTKRFKYLRISNQERVSGTPYDFECAFGTDVRMDHVIELHLHSVSIPNIANNVSAAIDNNVFQANFTIAGPFNIVIPDGFYSTSSMLAYLTTQINAFIGPSTIAITQDPITNLITFTITGAETMQILSLASGSTLAPTLGIYADSGAGLATYTTTSIPNFRGATYYFIHSLELGSNVTYLISQNGQTFDVNGIFSIPVDVAYGVNQTYHADSELDQIVFGRSAYSLRRFRITLRTNHGRLLTELPENAEVVIVLKVFWSAGIH